MGLQHGTLEKKDEQGMCVCVFVGSCKMAFAYLKHTSWALLNLHFGRTATVTPAIHLHPARLARACFANGSGMYAYQKVQQMR